MGAMESVRSHLNRYVAGMGESPIRKLFGIAHDPSIISFAGGHPAPELFDTEGLSRAFSHVIDANGGRALQYGPTDGEPEMREAAAKRLAEQGVPTSPANVLITSGSQQGLGLLSQTLFNPGDIVLVENPTYMSALQAFALQGVEFRALLSDEGGVIPEALDTAIRYWKPKAVYLIPTFQNPTGVTMPWSRRTAIADVIAAHDVWLIEDDPYSELRFTDEVLPPIVSDPRLDDRSFLANSLSKVLAPGLRVGWLRGPEEVLERVGVAKQGSALQTSTVDQLAAVHYLEHTDLESRLVTVRAEYASRMNTMVDELAEILPPGSVLTKPAGGMFVWARLPEGFDTSELVYRAIELGTIFVPGAPFYVEEPDERTMRFSFVSHGSETIAQGLRRMAPLFA